MHHVLLIEKATCVPVYLMENLGALTLWKESGWSQDGHRFSEGNERAETPADAP